MIWSGETWSSSGRADEEDDMDVVDPDHPDTQKVPRLLPTTTPRCFSPILWFCGPLVYSFSW
jgi:hypothetical protein